MATRLEVYAAIDSERDYQERRWPTPPYTQAQTVPGTLALLDSYLRQAIDQWARKPGQTEALETIRKIAGIAVHCMENNGAPVRPEAPVVPMTPDHIGPA